MADEAGRPAEPAGIGPRELRCAALRGLLVAHGVAALLVFLGATAPPTGLSPAFLGAALLGGATAGTGVGVAALLELRARQDGPSTARAIRVGLVTWALVAGGAIGAMAEVAYAHAALSGQSGWSVLVQHVGRLDGAEMLQVAGVMLGLTGPFGMAGAARLLDPSHAQALLARLLEAVAFLGTVTLAVGFVLGPLVVLLVLPLVLGGAGLAAGTRIALACWSRLEGMEAHLFRGES